LPPVLARGLQLAIPFRLDRQASPAMKANGAM
jgi:hypothetical protein